MACTVDSRSPYHYGLLVRTVVNRLYDYLHRQLTNNGARHEGSHLYNVMIIGLAWTLLDHLP